MLIFDPVWHFYAQAVVTKSFTPHPYERDVKIGRPLWLIWGAILSSKNKDY